MATTENPGEANRDRKPRRRSRQMPSKAKDADWLILTPPSLMM
jgi:hypothetical protein